MTGWRKADAVRLFAVLFIALLAGVVLDRVLLFLAAGLVVILVWYYRALQGVLAFIKQGKEEELPDLSGIVNELVRDYEIQRKQFLDRQDQLTGYLNRFVETTAALPDAVVVTASDGKIEWANKRAEDYLGIEWPRDTGQRLSNLIRYPDLVTYLKKTNEELESSPLNIFSPVNPGQRLEMRIKHYGDAYMLFVARDVTEIHRLNRIRKDFIANASHELRTPLTVIAGYLESFDEDKADCPDHWRPQIEQMRSQADRMQRLIEDLLALSSLESAEEAAPDDEVRVADMLDSIIAEARTLSGEQEHIFKTDVDTNVLLLGSHRDLYSAFSNLVFNAVQYTPPGGAVSVSWHCDEEGGARLQVSDTGEGIEKMHISRITERFYRVDKGRSRSKGGTGLGLAIVKHVLIRHEARLEIESVPGKGSDFICHFPSRRVRIHSEAVSDTSQSV